MRSLAGNWRFVFRHRALITWLGLIVLRRKAGSTLRVVVRWALVLSVIGAVAALAWWWFRRDAGGEDWKGPPEPEPAPPPAAPQSADQSAGPEPAVPVGV